MTDKKFELGWCTALILLIATGSALSANYQVTRPAFESATCCDKAGDANNDGNANVGDVVFIINYVFKGGDAPQCLAEGDANADGAVNVGDAVYVINYVFRGGSEPVCPTLRLTDGDVTPGSGHQGDSFSFEVIYIDPDNNAPDSAILIIDGIPNSMTKISGSFQSGALYGYQSTFDSGVHKYSFRFISNDNHSLSFPQSGYLVGPLVTPDSISISPNVKPMNELDSISLSSISESTFTYDYTSSPPILNAGDIIVDGDSTGYLRKVASYSIVGNQVIIETQDAAMAEAILEGGIERQIKIPMTGASKKARKGFFEATYLAEGITVSDGGLNLDNTQLFNGDVNGVNLDVRIASGRISFEPDLDIELELDDGVKEFRAVASGELALSAIMAVTATGELSHQGAKKIAELRNIQYFTVGIVPVVVVTKLSFTAAYETEIDIANTISFGVVDTTQVSFGLQYQNSDWSPVWERSNHFIPQTPSIQISAEYSEKLYLKPRLDIELYSVAGPYLEVSPFVALTGEMTAIPPCWSYDLKSGIEGKVGIQAHILDYDLLDYSYNLFTYEVVILHDEGCTIDVPVLTTAAVSAITDTSAQCGGTITSEGAGPVTDRGVCWSMNPPPTVNDNITTDGTGPGEFVSSITGLTEKTTYYVAAYATNSAGTGYGDIIPFTTDSIWGTVTDIDGNVYKTVKIGSQWWMAENLKVTHYRNGNPIPNVTDWGAWASLTTGAYCNYNNDVNNVATYGRLYNWYSVNDGRLAPAGWHVPSDAEWQPSDAEWQTLVVYLGGSAVAGGKMKETGTAHWQSPNTGATNESGFSALPGGGRESQGYFTSMGYFAWFWTSTDDFPTGDYVWYRGLSYDSSHVDKFCAPRSCGMSVRCVKD